MILLTYCILAQILVQKKYVKKPPFREGVGVRFDFDLIENALTRFFFLRISFFCCTFARKLRADNIVWLTNNGLGKKKGLHGMV